MAFTKRNPGEARSSGTRNAPKGTVKGKTPPSGGKRVGGKGRGSAGAKNSGKAGKY